MLISKKWITSLLQNAGNEGWTVSDEELDAGFVRVGFETEGYQPLPCLLYTSPSPRDRG